MQQANQMSLLRQMRVVLLSYVTRTGFRSALLGAASGYAITKLAFGVARLMGHHNVEAVLPLELVSVLGGFAIIAGLFCMLILFLWHARQQLMGPPSLLIPGSRNANLMVATILFLAIALTLTLPAASDPHRQFFGVFIVMLAFLTTTAWAVCNPLLAPIPAVLMLLAARNLHVYSWMLMVTESIDLSKHVAPNRIVQLWWEANTRTANCLRVAVALGDALALVILEKLARPRKRAMRFPAVFSLFAPRTSPSIPVFSNARHRLVDSVITRSFHRRFAVHDWRAAGVAALGIAGLTVWLGLQFRHDAMAVISMLIALLPGALVAIGWRDRWAVLDFESLYPVSRRQFVTDMAAGLIFDAAEFWVASIAAGLLACACMRLPGLYDTRLWIALVMGGMLQFVWIGGVFFIGQRRETFSYIAGLSPFALAIFLTLEALWRNGPPFSHAMILLIALAEMASGVTIFLLTWAFLQRSPRSFRSFAV